MRILVIDNNMDPESRGAEDLCVFARKVADGVLTVRRAPEGDLPPEPRAFDRVVISGSRTSAMDDAPWISQLHEFIRRFTDLGRPLLGVCYGHQSLIRAFGTVQNVRKAATPEFGWSEIIVEEPNPLLKGLGERFHTFSSHFDEVSELPEGFRRLARSEACAVQACRLEDRAVYGIQFHPEKDLPGAIRSLAEKKKSGHPPNLLHPDRSRELFDPKVGETIFRNFFEL